MVSNLKSLPLRLLHHFIASTIQCRIGSFTKVTNDDIWLLERKSESEKINLGRFLINKMIKVLNDKEKKAKGKQKSTQGPSMIVPYVTLITQYMKSLGTINARYEMLPLVVSYNVALITKMGYKDRNNDGNFVKIRSVGDDDNDNDENQAITIQDAFAPAPQAITILVLHLLLRL